ncbi:chromosomal replication initiator protein DnaA [Dissulfurirhabdus thermomarina]|uniref:Chromosomal replication initiator protein DnaA n=1 Tax=Dissulfurirhabdus thermomarina TaxID=1765737 RepID=A0A6N9TRY4_DISTH|nr:chromosomal replication initiator protein DnaA [Dissulfurirhabdus thermomarina]NDY43180.1 chromosomal replication initiator protein DnaA [Dissulfurirhabdus thermomarina]NMX22848.1 chromosomal replication initiator protein DnaA [Dissulfurirhabdus thermomarina]
MEEKVWESLKEVWRQRVSPSSYEVWIAPLTFAGAEGDTLLVQCPNQFFASWIREHYLPLLKDHLAQGGRRWNLRLCPVEEEREAARGQLHLPRFSPTEIARPAFCQRFTFEEFVVGACNRYAHAACWAAANEEPNHSRILYVHAPAGLGKSHLIQALGQRYLERRPKARVCYLTANDFTAQVVRAIKNDGLDDFKRRYRESCDVLMLEEAHCFAGRERTQSELALALDILLDDGKTVVFTGSQLPREIPKVNDQLRSRLAGGLITSINPPDTPTRRKIILRKAASQGVDLDPGVVDYLARHLQGDIRQIEGAVAGLVAKSSLLREPVNMDLARDVVRELVGEAREITLEAIGEVICRYYQVSCEDLRSRSRRRAVSWPRQVAMYLARRFTEDSLEAIGRHFNRDHATVLHSVKRITAQIQEKGKLRRQVEFLTEQLQSRRWKA